MCVNDILWRELMATKPRVILRIKPIHCDHLMGQDAVLRDRMLHKNCSFETGRIFFNLCPGPQLPLYDRSYGCGRHGVGVRLLVAPSVIFLRTHRRHITLHTTL